MAAFDAMGIPDKILRALEAMGYAEPTPVQEKGIGPLLEGHDVILEAQTGSGKTAAFGVPAVAVGSLGPGLRVIILVPTRELARQVAEEVRTLGTGSPFRAVAITGGVAAEKEDRTLSGDVRCIIATPGRLLALIELKTIKLDQLALVVLDEADRMLDLGFRTEIEAILKATAHRKQTALVSATLPKDVVDLASRHLKEPVDIRATPRALPESLVHYRLNVFPETKQRAIIALLQKEDPKRCIVFAHTRERATALSKTLKKMGFATDSLQGKMKHEQRRHVFELFARGVSRILVATDIASRGLDVPEMELVVNLDLPEEAGAYTHRAGRAARLGRAGRVISLVLPEEKEDRIRLEKESGGEWIPYKLDAAALNAVVLPEDAKPTRPSSTLAPRRFGSAADPRAPPAVRNARAPPAPRDTRAPPPARGGPRAPPARAPTTRAPPARSPPRAPARSASPVPRDLDRARIPRPKQDDAPPEDVPASRKTRSRR